MAKKIFVFIVLLRAFSAMIITNSHYTGVYPNDIFANGGLLGDVLFFSISGFCLANIKEPFWGWFQRRSIRVYVPTLIATVIFVAIGAYKCSDWFEGLKTFVWPTNYHFVGSIIFLYLPFYFFCKHVNLTTKNFATLSLMLFAQQLLIYLTVYERGIYHIDNVRQPMIEFLFLQSMLLGAYYRRVTEGERPAISWMIIGLGAALIVGYFVSKLAFVKNTSISDYQILNQIILFLLLWSLFRIVYSLEGKLQNMPSWLNDMVKFLADRALEIYLVQYVVIPHFDSMAPWPWNWFLVTGMILVAAYILHFISEKVLKLIAFK